MDKAEYIAKHKKTNLVLVQHIKHQQKDGNPIFDYLPFETAIGIGSHGWAIVSDIETPPEFFEDKQQKDTILETIAPSKRGRKPKTK